LYKSCGTVAADQTLLDIIDEQNKLQPMTASRCWRFWQDLCVFWAKNGFCNAQFSEFGG